MAEAVVGKEVAEELLSAAEKKAEEFRTEVERLAKALADEKTQSAAKLLKKKKAIARKKKETKELQGRIRACEALNQDALSAAQTADEKATRAEERARISEERAQVIEADAVKRISEADARASEAASNATVKTLEAEKRASDAVAIYKSSNDFKDEVIEASCVSYEVGFDDCKQAVAAIYPDLDLSRVAPPLAGEGQGDEEAKNAEGTEGADTEEANADGAD